MTRKAMGIFESTRLDDGHRQTYEARLKWLRDETRALETKYISGRIAGIVEGRAEGRLEGPLKGTWRQRWLWRVLWWTRVLMQKQFEELQG